MHRAAAAEAQQRETDATAQATDRQGRLRDTQGQLAQRKQVRKCKMCNTANADANAAPACVCNCSSVIGIRVWQVQCSPISESAVVAQRQQRLIELSNMCRRRAQRRRSRTSCRACRTLRGPASSSARSGAASVRRYIESLDAALVASRASRSGQIFPIAATQQQHTACRRRTAPAAFPHTAPEQATVLTRRRPGHNRCGVRRRGVVLLRRTGLHSG